MASSPRRSGLSRLINVLALLTFFACGGCTGYLAYGRLVLLPDADAVAKRFLAALTAGDARAAHALMGTRRCLAPAFDLFAADAEARAVLLTRVKKLELGGHELVGVTGMTLKGPVAYENGLAGEATVALEREALDWRVVTYDVASAAQMLRQRDDAKRVAQDLIEALRAGEWGALARTLHPELVRRMGEDKLRALQKSFNRRVDEAKFTESKTRAEHPVYELHGCLRTAEGPPYDVRITLRWERAGIRATDVAFAPSAVWLADQKNLARQTALNFIAALRAGDGTAAIGVCHPQLVETLTAPKLVELAQQFPQKLSDVVFDEARSKWQHPTCELVGTQKTLAGPELPATLRVQYVEGRHWVTGFSFE